jgi:dephospho-CoA kinase
MIGEQAARQADQAGDRPVVFDVPLLNATSAWRRRVDRVLVIDCRESTQLERVMRRNGWPQQTVERVMAQQLTRSARRRLADAVIFNDGLDLPALRAEVEHLWGRWVTA